MLIPKENKDKIETKYMVIEMLDKTMRKHTTYNTRSYPIWLFILIPCIMHVSHHFLFMINHIQEESLSA